MVSRASRCAPTAARSCPMARAGSAAACSTRSRVSSRASPSRSSATSTGCTRRGHRPEDDASRALRPSRKRHARQAAVYKTAHMDRRVRFFYTSDKKSEKHTLTRQQYDVAIRELTCAAQRLGRFLALSNDADTNWRGSCPTPARASTSTILARSPRPWRSLDTETGGPDAIGLLVKRRTANMGLGLQTESGGGDYANIIKFDARAGRMFRIDRSQDGGGKWQTNNVEVTNGFQAVVDMENIQRGLGAVRGRRGAVVRRWSSSWPAPSRPSRATSTSRASSVMVKLGQGVGRRRPRTGVLRQGGDRRARHAAHGNTRRRRRRQPRQAARGGADRAPRRWFRARQGAEQHELRADLRPS
jgi:hypothetical protein